MLTLDLTNTPHWHDLAPGVRVQLRPLTTALMVATRSDPVVESLPEEASDEERAVAFAKALARRAVLAWEGIAESLYYSWSKEFLEAGKRRLSGDTARQATSPEVKDLRSESLALKECVADLTLENRLLKKSMTGNGEYGE